MCELYPMPGCHVERVTRSNPAEVIVATRASRRGARCPSCGAISYSVHSTYTRYPQDLPSLGREVRLELQVRRFYCRNNHCVQRTFAERLPVLIAPHARRTRRLTKAQSTVGIAIGGEAGARLLKKLSMPASADTILRLLRRIPLPHEVTPTALGVDDWAIKKGRTYGTILVDLDQHRVVDLVPDRTASTLATWLGRHPGVERITRDRSTEYARGASAGAPHATQVADRWHLLLNARQMAERWLAGVHGRLRQLPPISTLAPSDLSGTEGIAVRDLRDGAFRRTHAEVVVSADSRTRRLAVYEEVRRRYRRGEPLLHVSRELGLARATVRKYAYAETFPERAAHPLCSSILDPFLPHLARRHAGGCENAMMLWREVRAMGFTGTSRQVHRWLQIRRTVPARTTPLIHNYSARGSAPRATCISALHPPKHLAWLLVQRPAMRTPTEAAVVQRIEQDSEAAHVCELVQRFAGLVRDHTAEARAAIAAFNTWLTDALKCGVRAVMTFAAGLQQDGEAVRAALTTPWSNAQSEGQITKLKLLKRQMYGRANFDLLRRRVLLAA